MSRKFQLRSALLGACIVILLLSVNAGAAGAARTTRAAAVGSIPATCSAFTEFQSGNFSSSLKINNKYYPLVPGMQLTLEGTTSEGTHTVVTTVTDLAKVVDGVTARVLWDRDYDDGELVESELALQAQDDSGNVWVLGEYPEELEGGKFAGAPYTWIQGIDGAQGGVLVPGKPNPGMRDFIEAKSLSIDFWDCGQVGGLNQTVTIPSGKYSDALVINEWAPLEPDGGIQQKFYVPGMGNVLVGAVDDPEAETLVLTSQVMLDQNAMKQVRNEAIKLDRHGRKVSSIYAQTSDLEVMP